MINQILSFLGTIGAFFIGALAIFAFGSKKGKEEIKNKQNEEELNLIKKNNEIKDNNNNLSNKDIIDGL